MKRNNDPGNNIGEGSRTIGEALKVNKTLRVLKMSSFVEYQTRKRMTMKIAIRWTDNNIRAVVKELCEALMINSSLTELALGCNSTGPWAS